MKKTDKIEQFREYIERAYSEHPTNCGGSFGEILCYEIHSQPVNPRLKHKTHSGGFYMGLTFKELAQKWGISVSFLGDLIAEHCRKLEEK